MTDPRRDPVPMREAQHSFDVVLRGYDRHQVAETIERLDADLRVALADRDAAMGRAADLAGQLSALHGELDQLRRKAASSGPATFEGMSERISHMLRLAEEEAADIRRTAEEEAQALREQTAAEERAMLERHAAGQAEVERMIAEARQSAEQIASKAQIRADELVTKAQEKANRLDAESQARRTKVEEDFEIAQRARRQETARLEEERERTSAERARQRITAAEEHAARVVSEAEAAAAAIRAVRDELVGRLADARRVLDGLPDLGDRRPEPAAGRPPVPAAAETGAAGQPGQAGQAEATRPPEVAGPQTRPQRAQTATGPQEAAPAPTGPRYPVHPGDGPSPGAGEAAAARQPTRPPVRADAPTQQAVIPPAPSPQQTQQIRPVDPAAATGDAAPPEQGPPTLVQPAVRPDASDSGSEPVSGRR
ncbi:hypothetical protein [Geodermatophilus marinus]|uniref:hypothetical protein n=1 Tax=Geodermatophilus sp. LHW52908 TaxID=2303986 RepID=UPI000E3BE2D9|nr:hypothetical protein [Geodermatophilus sp. LHW52908]RFU19759.1 hypothetical protein D0Z06_19840 [Geodermatophilus sp. LHW52908]